jgi:hypothetical protein
VWTEPTAQAERLVVGDALLFQVELERRAGHHLGTLSVADRPRAYPLKLQLARAYIGERLALIGDAAHVVHPIAGQGLNLGFRDVAALAETIVEAHRLGLDPGSLAVLRRYERWRRFDTFEMGAVTDGLNRLFSNDNPALRIVRDVGLGLVDRLPGLKRMFIREAAGAGGDLPRLLRGEGICASFLSKENNPWMAGTRPAMTILRLHGRKPVTDVSPSVIGRRGRHFLKRHGRPCAGHPRITLRFTTPSDFSRRHSGQAA